jgi:hypothetical protein
MERGHEILGMKVRAFGDDDIGALCMLGELGGRAEIAREDDPLSFALDGESVGLVDVARAPWRDAQGPGGKGFAAPVELEREVEGEVLGRKVECREAAGDPLGALALGQAESKRLLRVERPLGMLLRAHVEQMEQDEKPRRVIGVEVRYQERAEPAPVDRGIEKELGRGRVAAVEHMAGAAGLNIDTGLPAAGARICIGGSHEKNLHARSVPCRARRGNEFFARRIRATMPAVRAPAAAARRIRFLLGSAFMNERTRPRLLPPARFLALALCLGVAALAAEGPSPARRVPVIYSTDLYHPHVDPDDHFDLATLFAIPEIDIRAVILDDGAMQKARPGIVAVTQLMAITGRKVPLATGLAPRLVSPRDTAQGQPPEFQGGVELILATLRESNAPVTLAAVGSLRDYAAAVNREPELCRTKIARMYIFIGDAHTAPDFTFREYNVQLDVNAYIRIMQSGLPVYWVPCFDGGIWRNAGRASLWRAPHRALLEKVRDPVKQYFIYALLKKKEVDPVRFLGEPVKENEWNAVLAETRNLWCCAVFTHMADRIFVRQGETWVTVPAGSPPGGAPVEPFRFEEVLVNVDATGMAVYPAAGERYRVRRFAVADPRNYEKIMTSATAQLLAQLGTK